MVIEEASSTALTVELLCEVRRDASIFHADDAEAYVFIHWRELLLKTGRSEREIFRDEQQ